MYDCAEPGAFAPNRPPPPPPPPPPAPRSARRLRQAAAPPGGPPQREKSAAAATAAAESAAVRIEDSEQQRQEARVGARLENHRVAARLDRLRLSALERLVRRDRRERLGVHVRDVLDARRARPTGAGAVGHAAGERESRIGRAIVGEQALRVRVAGRLTSFFGMKPAPSTPIFSAMSMLSFTMRARSAGP